MAGRLALLVAGAWLGALMLSWAIATTSFRTDHGAFVLVDFFKAGALIALTALLARR